MELGIPVKIFHRKQFEKSNINELVIHLWCFCSPHSDWQPIPLQEKNINGRASSELDGVHSCPQPSLAPMKSKKSPRGIHDLNPFASEVYCFIKPCK